MPKCWAMEYGYIACAATEAHDHASMLQIRCQRADLPSFAPFQELVEKLNRRLLACPSGEEPRFLDRSNIPPDQMEAIQRECRAKALAQGIPDEDIPLYASRYLQERLGSLCFNEMDVEGQTVAAHVRDFSSRYGPIVIVSFFKQSIYD